MRVTCERGCGDARETRRAGTSASRTASARRPRVSSRRRGHRWRIFCAQSRTRAPPLALRGQAALGPLGDEAEPAAMLLAGSHVLGRLEARLEEHGKHAQGAPSRIPTKLPAKAATALCSRIPTVANLFQAGLQTFASERTASKQASGAAPEPLLASKQSIRLANGGDWIGLLGSCLLPLPIADH